MWKCLQIMHVIAPLLKNNLLSRPCFALESSRIQTGQIVRKVHNFLTPSESRTNDNTC